MEKKYLLFDLDGTLTDPMAGITRAVQYALKHYGIVEEDLTKLCPFIGPPLKDSFMEFYGFEEEKAQEAVHVYREYFSKKGIFENKIYPDTRATLEKLRAQGKVLILATSKPEVFARQILDYFEITEYFTEIGGADLEETRTKKGDVIAYVLEKAGIQDKEKTVMIGDRLHDIKGGKENGLATVGVLYGYGSRKELEEAGADDIIENIAQLVNMW